jgi:hypothetical protein
MGRKRAGGNNQVVASNLSQTVLHSFAGNCRGVERYQGSENELPNYVRGLVRTFLVRFHETFTSRATTVSCVCSTVRIWAGSASRTFLGS